MKDINTTDIDGKYIKKTVLQPKIVKPTQYWDFRGVDRCIICEHHLIHAEGQDDCDLQWHSLPGGDWDTES